MTEIQMTETPKESVLNIEEFGFWSLFRICGCRLENSTNFGFAAHALKTVRASNLIFQRPDAEILLALTGSLPAHEVLP